MHGTYMHYAVDAENEQQGKSAGAPRQLGS